MTTPTDRLARGLGPYKRPFDLEAIRQNVVSVLDTIEADFGHHAEVESIAEVGTDVRIRIKGPSGTLTVFAGEGSGG